MLDGREDRAPGALVAVDAADEHDLARRRARAEHTRHERPPLHRVSEDDRSPARCTGRYRRDSGYPRGERAERGSAHECVAEPLGASARGLGGGVESHERHSRSSNRSRQGSAIVNQMANQVTLDRAFAACAHPIRRGIVERLAERDEGAGEDMTVGEATRDFAVSKPAISRHLRVLEEAGAIVRVIDGRTHRLRLAEQPFDDAADWIGQLQKMWQRKFDVVEQFIAESREDAGAGTDGGSA